MGYNDPPTYAIGLPNGDTIQRNPATGGFEKLELLVMSQKTEVGFKKSAVGETAYEGGAHRDSRNGKGAPEWMPSQALALVSCIYEAGNKGRSKTGNGDDRNWENGMKIGDLLGSAIRHIERYREGDRSEPHLPQAVWNLLNAIQMGIWVSTGYRSKLFNNLVDHIHSWRPGDEPPPALSQREIDWLKLRGIEIKSSQKKPIKGKNFSKIAG